MTRREISCGSYHLTKADNNGNKCIEVNVGRKLTSGETTLLRSMFGNAIDYNTVRIYDKKFITDQGDTMAIAPNGNIYFAPKVHKKDFSLASDVSKHFFIHEMTHVWQYQNGQTVALRAIGEQLFFEFPSQAINHIGKKLSIEINGFKGAYSYELDVRKDLLDYGIEQQASIVADYWAMKNGLHVELRNSIRATNRNDAYLTHYRRIVDTVVKKY